MACVFARYRCCSGACHPRDTFDSTQCELGARVRPLGPGYRPDFRAQTAASLPPLPFARRDTRSAHDASDPTARVSGSSWRVQVQVLYVMKFVKMRGRPFNRISPAP